MTTDFLSSRTSIFDLRSVVTHPTPNKRPATRRASNGSISWREFLADQPTLGKNERFPDFFVVPDGDLILSDIKVVDYYHLEDLNVWIPPQHEVMVKTIRAEIADNSIAAHGTGLGYSRGCTGPLCRRYHREITADQARLRSERLRMLKESKMVTEGRLSGVRRSRIDLPEYQRLKTGAPAYAAVDALLVLYCMAEYAKFIPPRLNGRIKEWQESCSDRAKIALFMHKKYGNDVFFL